MAGRLAGRTLLTCLLVSFVVCTSWHTASAGDGKVKSKEVDFAPEADLINGNDDIDPNGHCAEEIKNYCSSVTAGLGALAKCISENIDQMDMPEASDGTESVVVSDYCREEVYGFYIERNTNINKNVPLAKACKIDANKFCNVTWFFGYKAGQVIACLRDVKDKLTPTCQKQVQEVQQEGGRDWRADPQLHEACEVDATSLCKDVRNGAGRVQACLRDKRMQLSWACEEQLFRQEMENADDIRLSMRLYAKCLPDKRKFCAEVAPGSARVKDCLEEHRNEKDFSDECKEEVDTMIERRVRDFRLDSRLRTVCETDIYSMCAFFGDLDTIDNDDASVIRCLQDYVGEIQSDKCKAQVKKYQQLAAEDIRFDVPLADACYEDRQKLCASVPPGSARVIRCLTNQRSKLSSNCRAVMFDEEVRFSENIDFQFPMKAACKDELELYCKDVPHGQARAIRCLQDNKFKKDFGKECREAVRSYENESASDYRLNFRLSTSCRNDIQELCKDVCKAEDGQICSGRVLRCLTEHIDEVKSDACQKEVFYFEKMEVTDFRNDVILAAACRADVESYCDKIEPGEGRVHECLRKFRSRISEQCRKEELLLEEQEAENVELRPSLLKSCRDERQMFCKDVAPGQARVFRCLAEKMSDLDFGDTCRGEIINKLQRRQANWKLDPPLRKACRRAVQEHCAAEDRTNGEEGVVYKCLIRQFDDVDAGCQKELGRAVHMAFYVWQPGAILTADCDDDIQKLCLASRPNMAKTPGAVGTCLAGLLELMGSSSARRMLPDTTGKDASSPPAATLSEKCRAISDVAEPPNMKHAFEASLSVALLQSQLTIVESATGWQTMKRDRNGVAQSVTLTGWTALAGIAALIVCIMWAGSYAYKRYRGINEGPGYTVVLKGKH